MAKGKQKGMDQIGAGNFGSLSAEGWKQDNDTFQSVYLIKLQELMLVGLPRTVLKASPHTESKTKLWKNQYNCLT